MSTDDIEIRLTLLEHDVKKHMEDEEKFWGVMKVQLAKIDSQLVELTATRNKWMGIGIGVVTLGSVAFGLFQVVSSFFNSRVG